MQKNGLKERQDKFPSNLSELIQKVCFRPAMYSGRADWDVTAAFIGGCWWTLIGVQPDIYTVEEFRAFNRWLAEKFNYPRNYAWMAIRGKFPDDATAFAALPSLYDEFRAQYAPSVEDAQNRP